MILCYIINLDRSPERWQRITQSAGINGLNIVRVPAIDGRLLEPPYPHFSDWGYFLCHGRKINPNQVACYCSHLKALQTFLDSGETHGVICEDDVHGTTELPAVLDEVLRYSDVWDLVRLNGFRRKFHCPVAKLTGGYRLVSDVRSGSGAGCYLVNRYAAERILTRLGVMRQEYDVALYYGFPIGIREMTVTPFPVLLDSTSSHSQIGYSDNRYPIWSPYRFNILTALPYRFLTRNCRLLSRLYFALRNYRVS
ncbi:hypothetical protein FACS189454_02220 [Planctomycetales bacterium]|nr:hypothetical protein FACS189454_02220 [Planctomycetales bacterium]